ncbi:hypothetical protein GOBAR_DD17739 [Gossypium barbadense]|nr:hypothetical protein GOBAR_DD17739 [Gossypium barbadense]
MDRYSVEQQIVLPIFYHVNPSDVENIDGSFKKSFDEHETRRSVDEVKQWKTAFAEVGKLVYSRAISASNLSILVLSKAYASSKSCLGELSDIMDRKHNPTDKHNVHPVFYHVDPSDVRNSGGHFKTSFEEHESEQPADRVQQWKTAFAEVGKLKGWHIEGGKFDRPETEYIKDVVEYVIKKLTNIGFESASEELVGIEYQKNAMLKLIKQKDCRVIGLWGMGGQGKSTLAEAVYKKLSSEFESHCFLQNVREEIKKQGKGSLRNKFLSELLKSNVDIGTPSIGSTLSQERLNKMKVLVVLDDVDDSDQIDYMGVRHFGYGSKTIITSRDRQVLESGGADTIHEVKGLNENCSLQLFSNFAFKQLNPAVGFQDLSRSFRRPLIIYMHDTLEEMGKDIVCQESKTLGKCSRLWNLKHVQEVLKYNKDLVHLRKINLFSCKNLKKIPNFLGALNLERPNCENCESLVKLPSLARLTSLKTLRLEGCRSLKKFPEIPNYFYELDLSETGIKEVPDFIEHLGRLQWLTLTNSMVKDVSSNISKLKSLFSLDLSGCPIVKFSTVDVRSPSLRFKSLKYMHMDRCKSLKLISELPPYLLKLNVLDCTSLEKVSFADQNLYQFDYLDADDACFYEFTMLFRNCFNLNQESINNIEANAMLKIRFLAKKLAARFDCCGKIPDLSSLICCFPGNKISANKFKCQSMNSSLSLKIAPNGGGGSRFLVFVICLVADLTHCRYISDVECICKYQLTATDGGNDGGGGGYEKLRSKISLLLFPEPEKYKDYHVFILSTADMVKEDQNYEEASFKFYIRVLDLRRGGKEYIKVERCGAHDQWWTRFSFIV